MNRKSIAYILFVPTLIMLLHSIVPHHHHFDDLFKSNTKKTCSKIHKEQQQNSKACHAFNSSSVLVEKQLKKSITPIKQIAINFDLQLFINFLFININNYLEDPNTPMFQSEFFGNQISFRGPPHFN